MKITESMFLTRRSFRFDCRTKIQAFVIIPLSPLLRFCSCLCLNKKKSTWLKKMLKDAKRHEKAINRLKKDFDIVKLMSLVRENSQI
jgi:hypothetical protein